MPISLQGSALVSHPFSCKVIAGPQRLSLVFLFATLLELGWQKSSWYRVFLCVSEHSASLAQAHEINASSIPGPWEQQTSSKEWHCLMFRTITLSFHHFPNPLNQFAMCCAWNMKTSRDGILLKWPSLRLGACCPITPMLWSYQFKALLELFTNTWTDTWAAGLSLVSSWWFSKPHYSEHGL